MLERTRANIMAWKKRLPSKNPNDPHEFGARRANDIYVVTVPPRSVPVINRANWGMNPLGTRKNRYFRLQAIRYALKHRANMAFTFEELFKELHNFPIQKPSTASTQREVSLSSRQILLSNLVPEALHKLLGVAQPHGRIFSSSIVRSLPGRASSRSPSMRSFRNRRHHLIPDGTRGTRPALTPRRDRAPAPVRVQSGEERREATGSRPRPSPQATVQSRGLQPPLQAAADRRV
jgi:hypothetical protein